MYYAWIFFENRFKDVYLPPSAKWAEMIALRQSDTGWERDYFIPIRSLDGACFVAPPERFRWMEGERIGENEERPVTNGTRYYMGSGARRIGIVFTECEPSDTAFRKFVIPRDRKLRLGRGEECELRIAPEIGLISMRQGELQRKPDGSCVFTDSSANGSYLNGMLFSGDSIRLNFGDIVTLNVGVKFIYLGEMLAINRMSAFSRIDLKLAEPVLPSPGAQEQKVPPVQILFHRAPRFFQKPDTSELRIEPPIDPQQQREQPLWLTLGPSTTMVLPMLVGSAVSSARGGFMGAGLAMVGTASCLAVFWGLMNYRFRKKQSRRVEDARVEKYALYISQAEEFLGKLTKQELRRLLETCPSVEECAAFLQNSSYRLWERMPNHPDFMSARLGLGEVPLPNPIRVEDVKLSAVDDPLRDEPARLYKTYHSIPSAPVTINLREEHILGILGGSAAVSLAQSLLLQLTALHSYHDVRVVVISDESEHSHWAWVRWLPHAFASEDRQLRMVVSKPSAVQEVLNYLDEVLLMRTENSGSQPESERESIQPLPHYVVFCTRPELLENKPIFHRILTKPMGVSLVLLGASIDALPKECRFVLDIASQSGMIYTGEGDIRPVRYEYSNLATMQSYSRMMAPLRLKDSAENAAIPTMVSFLNLYGVHRVEQLDVWRFWNENHVYEGLRSTIGLRAGGQPFVLDISDKCHGPHGLVAGTTGSGKSVMLQTYILSLAVNYHPDQIRFILIDYKGGGMADAFRNLPHVTGIIDNLQSGNTIARALASIQGEIHRREQIFRKAGVSSIDDYIRFYYDDPEEERLPHLIIIVDEFAELKTDQPDFMQELISASRVGRSLGVHLILSTQKPSNSVSDEIWANSNFRICLRVQSRSDSMEMLRRPDAAYLKNKGRVYIQVGNDEIFEQAQTSYSGMSYNPNEPSESELPHLLDDAGRLVSVKRSKTDRSARELTEMDVVLDRIIQTAKEHGLPASYHLWMEEMPAAVFLDRLLAQEDGEAPELWRGPNTGEELKAVYALGDDVLSQRQFRVWMDLMSGRNHMIVGMASTGKTTMVQTLVMSFARRYSPAALQMYILSLSSRTLGNLAELPHVGEIIYDEESNELRRLLRLLEAEDQRRRALFAEASTDSFLEFNRSRAMMGEDPVPAIIVFADRFGQIGELLGDDDEFTTLLYALIREANARGIFFVVTAMRVNEIPYKIRDCFKGVGLQINDRADYAEIVGMRMPPEMPDIAALSGRGLVRIEDRLFEIQTALGGQSATDVARASELGELCRRMNEAWDGPRPQGIPRIPEHPTMTDLLSTPDYRELEQDPWQFAFSYSTATGLPERIALDKSHCFLVSGAAQTGKTSLLQLIAVLWARRGARVCVAADGAWSELCRRIGAERYEDFKGKGWEAFTAWIDNESKRRAALRKEAQLAGPATLDELVRGFEPIVIVIDDLEKLISGTPQIAAEFYAKMIGGGAKFGIYLYASISHNAYAQNRAREPLVTLARQQCGVALGGKLNECDPWNVHMPFAKKSQSLPLGEAYLINNGNVSRVVVPKLEDGEVEA